MKLSGTPDQIYNQIAITFPEVREKLAIVANRIPPNKRSIYEYQAAALYALAAQQTRLIGEIRILEIGTALGYSAAVMAMAVPKAHITTLNPKDHEFEKAVDNLTPWPNVQVLRARSWEYLAYDPQDSYDLIFVDGDHARIWNDLPWFNRLNGGTGLILFHDYAPAGTRRECPPVFETLNDVRDVALKRDFDISVIDDGEVGLVGWRRKMNEFLVQPQKRSW